MDLKITSSSSSSCRSSQVLFLLYRKLHWHKSSASKEVRSLSKTRSPCRRWILVSSESQSFHATESIVEIKQIQQMNGSKTWLERNWLQHKISSNFFQISWSFFSNKNSYERNDVVINPLLFLEEDDVFSEILMKIKIPTFTPRLYFLQTQLFI